MKRVRVVRMIAVVAVALTPLLSGGGMAQAKAETAAASSQALHAEELALAANGLPASQTQADAARCAQPVSARSGAWFCPVPSAHPDANGQYCKASECWTQDTDTVAEYSEAGYYGYDSTTLGENNSYAKWTLSGSSNRAKPFWTINSSSTNNILLEGDLLYGNVGQAGTEVSGKSGLYPKSSAGPNVQVTWSPNGYLSQDAAHTCYSQLLDWTWSVPGYPGYWLIQAKSIVYCKHSGDTTYYFQGDDQLPSSPSEDVYVD
jgi:hypothetical protein